MGVINTGESVWG